MFAKPATLTLTALLFLGMGLAPLMALWVSSLSVDGAFGLDRYLQLWSSPKPLQLFGHSLLLAGLTTLIVTVLGVPLGILFGKTTLRLRTPFLVLFTLPLLIPPYFLSLGWFSLLGREGWLVRLFPAAETVAKNLADLLFGLPGCVLTLSTVFLPLIILVTAMLLQTVNPRMEEAARLYASWRSVLFYITLPAIFPGILFMTLLVFMLTLGEITVPLTLRYAAYPTEILTQFAAFYDFDSATATASPLALLAFLMMMTEWHGRRWAMPDLRPMDTSLMIQPDLSAKLMMMLAAGLALVMVLLPLGALGLYATLDDFSEAWTRGYDALLRSLFYAAVGASLLTVTGFFLGLLWRERTCCSGITQFTALLLLILPGTVLGIGLIGLWNTPGTAWIYASPGILIIGYVIQYAALPGAVLHAVLTRLPPSLEQVAALAGAGWWRRLLLIVLPLSRRGLLLAWLVSYLFCLRDTGLAMLVYPPGEDTLPVRIYTLMANSRFGLVTALCTLMMVAALSPLAIFGLFPKRKEWP
ncbi:MAG: iron ABC transporter permease [Methyloglobulus sp.]|nr:iron ABC transporter permease [Methyloglobulus sp.]